MSDGMRVRLLVASNYGAIGQEVTVAPVVGYRLLQQRQAVQVRNLPLPDGLTVQFIAYCSHGSPGEVKTFSYGIAQSLIARHVAKAHTLAPQEPIPVPVVAPVPVKVTAICPTFNRKQYLPTSIASFLAQTYTDSELLIVDDSAESVEDIIPKHPRIRYVRMERLPRPEIYGHDGRMLIGAKRNYCCEKAYGEFIVHWDDDDWQAPGRIADQVAQLEKHNKAVLTYFNILYWNDVSQVACRCFPRSQLRALHGATFCYRRDWWMKHRFAENGGGEDTMFGQEANRAGQLLLTDAQKFIVVRAHGNDDESKDARGNTCRTSDHMNTPSIPLTRKDEIPAEFFNPLLGVVPGFEDAVIGVIKNYDWTKIRPYAVSLARTGFKGARLMFVENIPTEARENLKKLGFVLVDFVTPDSVREMENRDYLTFGRYRFKPVLDYLHEQARRFRYIVWCDVRDLVFQTNPSDWLDAKLAPHKIAAAGEGWLAESENYNSGWLSTCYPQHDWLRKLEVCCSGSVAGSAPEMIGLFENIYEEGLRATGAPNYADQAMFQYVLHTAYKDVMRVPRQHEGFVATAWPGKRGDRRLIDGFPRFDAASGLVYSPETNQPFCMVHQYDRDGMWKAIMERKYAQ